MLPEEDQASLKLQNLGAAKASCGLFHFSISIYLFGKSFPAFSNDWG